MKLANAASIKLSESEAGKFAGQINELLEYVEKINEVDTEGSSLPFILFLWKMSSGKIR